MTELSKRSASMSFSWESFIPPNGHPEPVGVKWLQWLGWAYYRAIFAVWRVLEKHLGRSRHFSPHIGYDCDSPEFFDFVQKTKWIQHEGKEDGAWGYRVL